MKRGVFTSVLCAGVLVLSACNETGSEPAADSSSAAPSPTTDRSTDSTVDTSTTIAAPTTAPPPTTRRPATTAPRRTTTTTTKTTVARQSTTTTPASTTTTTTKPRRTTTTTTAPPASTTTTTVAVPGVTNPECVVTIRPGDSLSAIAGSIDDDSVTVEGLQTENGIGDPNAINAGDHLDVCIGNDIDDVEGGKRSAPTTVPVNEPVAAQQRKLNELLGPYGMPALAIDGDSGSLTEQQLCAARIGMGQPASRADMEPGGDEAGALMAASGLAVPPTAPTSASRWVVIDKTCQVMFVGEGSSLVYVFPTSTGESGYETRDQNAVYAFRFEPEADNGGWHNSIDYPTDNPLNGNMYMPIYFDGGQAIHGANNVPTYPASKGCSRLSVGHQDMLIDWLGIRDITSALWNGEDEINLAVTVQGAY